jgi:hypothetical protein
MTGMQIGDLTVLAYAGMKNGCASWQCRCKCGRVVVRERRVLKKPNRRHNCKRCPRKVPAMQIWQMRALAKKGHNAHAIAVQLGIPKSRVRKWAPTEPYSRAGHKAMMKRVAALRAEGLSFRAVIDATGYPSAPRAYRSYLGKCLESRLHEFERKTSGARQVKALTAEGFSAETIAERLRLAARTVVRLRSRPVDLPLPPLDLDRIEKLRGRGLSWGTVNQRMGRPLECGECLEVAYNWLLDMKAEELLAA